MKALGWKRVLIIDGIEIPQAFARASANIPNVDVLPTMGANVYDILKRDTLVITRAGVEALRARLADDGAGWAAHAAGTPASETASPAPAETEAPAAAPNEEDAP